MCQLSQGQIVDAEVVDPNGQNKKRRPLVVLTSTAEIAGSDEIVAVAISTKLPDPLPEDCIPLPWSPDGKAKSGLTEQCVAKCRWIVKLSHNDIVSRRGWLPGTVMCQIMHIVRKN